MKTTNVTDRRRYQRIKIEINAKVAKGQEISINGYTRDVSVKGFFLKCDQKVPIGTTCRVSLFLKHENEEVHVKADGVVVRHEDSGLAVELTKIDLDSITFVFWFFMVHQLLKTKELASE